jgi:hypothetical protein
MSNEYHEEGMGVKEKTKNITWSKLKDLTKKKLNNEKMKWFYCLTKT